MINQFQAAYREDLETVQGMLGTQNHRVSNTTSIGDFIQSLRQGIWHRSIQYPYRAPLVSQDLFNRGCTELTKSNSTQPVLQIMTNLMLTMSGVSIERPAATGAWNRGDIPDACQDAEMHFQRCIKQVAHPDYHYGQTRISVYHTKEGVGLLLRKQVRESTAITLQPLELEGIPIAAGTIVLVPADAKHQESGDEYVAKNCTFNTYELGPDLRLACSRLTPWAYDAQSAQLNFAVDFADGLPWVNDVAAGIITSVNMDRFRSAAVSIGRFCGIRLNGQPLEAARQAGDLPAAGDIGALALSAPF